MVVVAAVVVVVVARVVGSSFLHRFCILLKYREDTETGSIFFGILNPVLIIADIFLSRHTVRGPASSHLMLPKQEEKKGEEEGPPGSPLTQKPAKPGADSVSPQFPGAH